MSKYLGLLLLCLMLPVSAEQKQQTNLQQKGFIYGLGVSVSQELYKGYNRRIVPIPVLGYNSEYLNIYGPFVNINLLRAGAVTVALSGNPRFAGYDESDSDIFLGMEERKNSYEVGGLIGVQAGQWSLDFAARYDLLNVHKGSTFSSTLSRRFNYGMVFIEPSIGITIFDADLVNYYYGVRESEATATRPAYQAESSKRGNVGVVFSTPMWLNGFTQLGVNFAAYDREIENSPLVDTNKQLSLFLSFSKFF
ncbi:MipA/OmpV family protein [Thalassotalea agarivorans]|uniref:Outer membrane protein n=1 Tax=Thalassotalea agarivorans TaxID=349064 RepID=A0A1I0GUT4_THASX|nr:MipA/OmpV family protein [Thalassotalea agarivorans]SET74971.1 outer membrane protein [Thalassotalea agarivorans]